MNTAKRDKLYQDIFTACTAAGHRKADQTTPVPMIVGTSKTFLGNDIDRTKPVYFVEGGCCGFGWVVVSPGTSSFGRWLLKTGLGSKEYRGGVHISSPLRTQSMAKNEAFAEGFAQYLNELSLPGIRAYAQSRMD